VQLAQRVGAEIYATAGSPAKREYLRSLGVHHVMDSRSLSFGGEIASVRPAGVRVILNSLAGEFIPASLNVLADDGCFLEIGKRDIWSAEQVAAVKPQARYAAIDLTPVIAEEPQFGREMLLEVLAWIREGTLKPLPVQVYPLARAADAFRYMAQARHIGKVVLTARNERTDAPAGGGTRDVSIRGDGTYLITGGLGGLGLSVARWLVEQGARHLALAGRSQGTPAAREAAQALMSNGVHIEILQADVADEAQVAHLLTTLEQTMPPLRGIIHAAGVLDDAVLLQQDRARFERVMGPKVGGAWNLHRATRARGVTLDFFVLFSSVASVLGSAGQGNYAAANAFLDALAYRRRAEGLPALSINWGAWAEVGMAARLEHRVRDNGMGAMLPQQATRVLGRVLGNPEPQIVVAPIDWQRVRVMAQNAGVSPLLSDLAPGGQGAQVAGSAAASHNLAQRLEAVSPEEQRSLISAYLRAQVSQIMGVAPGDGDLDIPLSSLGLDSLMAVELRNRVQAEVGMLLSVAQLLEGVSVNQLVELLCGAADANIAPGDVSPIVPDIGTGDALDAAALNTFSDEQVDALLNDLLMNEGTSDG
jgi:NADPH:quinone reductase-like Zn-dependent oxidoreductase